MPRDANGNMTLVAGNPVVTRTAISSTVFNATIADLAAEIQDSLSRSGKGGMNVAMLFTDGRLDAPGIGFTLATDTGIRRVAVDGSVRIVSAGVDGLTVTSSGITADTINATNVVSSNVEAISIDRTGTITIGNGLATTITVGRSGQVVDFPGTISARKVENNTANSSITLAGNRDGADSGADVVLNSLAARTQGSLFEIQNNTLPKFRVDYNGEISMENGLLCGTAVKIDNNQTENNSTWTNVSNMTFSVLPNSQYVWEIIGTTQSSFMEAVNIRFIGPAGASAIHYGEPGGTAAPAFSTTIGVNGTTDPHMTHLMGVLVNGVNAGSVQLQFARSNAGVATWFKGSFLRWRQLTA